MVLSCRESLLYTIVVMQKTRLYFINYKNSVTGVGGVGTVSRDLVRCYPGVECVFWDGSLPARGSDISVDIGAAANREKIHLLFFKKYLWPVLHGIDYRVSSAVLNKMKHQLCIQSAEIIDSLQSVIGDDRSQGGDIFWVNDYTAVTLVPEIRKWRNESTIIFSFRTPFGVHSWPRVREQDNDLFISLLEADIITFHRKRDMSHYVRFLVDNAAQEVTSIEEIDDTKALVGRKNGHSVELMVVPMGSNVSYRKFLANDSTVRTIAQNIRRNHAGMKIVSSISRFEYTKGIEHELDMIDCMLAQYPMLKGKFVFLRYTYRSKHKKDDSEYSALHQSIAQRVEYINNKYGYRGWIPIVYSDDKKLDDREVTAVLQSSDIVIIAPVADGFNHLATEAIHSQERDSGKVQLLLSDIGVTDYVKGYQPLSRVASSDARVLRDALLRSDDDIATSYNDLLTSSGRLSSKHWLDTIISEAQHISRSRGDVK